MDRITHKKIGLALSGGGYRVVAYHIGTLRALNRLGILNKVDVISSVSGGSIVAAYYVLQKGNYEEFERTFIAKLQKGVLCFSIINLMIVLALILISVLLLGWCMLLPDFVLLFFFWFKLLPVSIWIEKKYDSLFFHKAKLSELPEKPLLAINSTNVATGTLFTFSRLKMSGYEYKIKDKKQMFNNKNFPVARAVMASSCVPFAFSPVKIAKQYYALDENGTRTIPNPKPLLIDGGLYDNQGAHKLSEKTSSYHTQLNIVSDAGLEEMSSKWAFNMPLLLIKTSNIMMRRIRTFQVRNNIYSNNNNDMRYAYLSLEWEVSDRPIRGFTQNIVKDHIAPELLEFHQIKKRDIEDLKNPDTHEVAEARLMTQLKQNIGWEQLTLIMPTQQEDTIAKSVGTNLTALKESQLNSLIKHSNWLTEVQVRLYLPYLVTNK
jgi:NTE family protein